MVGRGPRYRATIISDLHLRAGRGDDFKFDSQLASLLDTVARDGSRELILNGDVLDFVATRPVAPFHPDPGLGFTEEESVARLEAIAGAHGEAFEALERFMTDGNKCVIIPGNHDWEFHFPRVRQRMTELLHQPGSDKLQFVLHGRPYRPIPGLHIEHGHQLVDDQNIFHFPLDPLRPDPLGGPRRIEQSVGNWLVRCLVNPIERYFPFVNNVKPFIKIGWFQGVNIHSVRLATILAEGARGIMRDQRIPNRVKAVILSSPPFRNWLGPARSPLSRMRPEHVFPHIDHALNDDSTISLQKAARRHLQVFADTRYMIMGHSHEYVDHDHELNRYFARHGRAYLNPGSWNPCLTVPDDAEPLDIDKLVEGHHFPYRLAFIHVQGDNRDDLDASLQTFEQDEVWLTAA